MKKILATTLLALICLFSAKSLLAQEFNVNVLVNSSKLSGTDKTVFQNLQTALYEFINNTKWTNISFKTAERIEGSITINITEKTDTDAYNAELNMALRRPTYKASYYSPVFNYVDNKFSFSYFDGQPLEFNPTSYMSDLSSTIGYYLYMFLGYDFDTFSLYGGENFYKIAESVVSSAQSSNKPGWAMNGTKNRYWLVENMTNQVYRPLRQFLYEYHRLGLDVMSEKPDEGRAAITKSLQYLKDIYDSRPNTFFLQLLIESKRAEIIQIYSQGSQQEKTQVVNIMKAIDPSQSSEYDAILQGKSK
jgi:hypothetical protein